VGWPLMSERKPVVGQRKGLQPCNLVIGARDDSIAGDPCSRSLCVRALASDSSPWSGRQDHRRRVDRVGGRPGGDGRVLGPQVPWVDRLPAAGLVSPPARPIPIQPAAAPALALYDHGAADARAADRRGPNPACRRHPDQLRQLSRLRPQEPVRRRRRLWLLALPQPLCLGHAAGRGQRSQRGAGGL
jgi:hypothetical protein